VLLLEVVEEAEVRVRRDRGAAARAVPGDPGVEVAEELRERAARLRGIAEEAPEVRVRRGVAAHREAAVVQHVLRVVTEADLEPVELLLRDRGNGDVIRDVVGRGMRSIGWMGKHGRKGVGRPSFIRRPMIVLLDRRLRSIRF